MPWKKSVQQTAEKPPDDDDRGEVHGGGRVHADDGVEERAAGLDGRGGIDRVGHEEDHRAENLQRAGLREESVRQILGDGDRVACNDGEAAQARRLHEPADRIADGKAHADPDLSHAEGIDRGRQTHEHPRAHIGRAGGERRDPRAHLAAAEEVGLLAAGLILNKEVYADRQHEDQVQNKYDNFRCFHTESPNQIFNIPCSITHFSTDVNTEQRIERILYVVLYGFNESIVPQLFSVRRSAMMIQDKFAFFVRKPSRNTGIMRAA